MHSLAVPSPELPREAGTQRPHAIQMPQPKAFHRHTHLFILRHLTLPSSSSPFQPLPLNWSDPQPLSFLFGTQATGSNNLQRTKSHFLRGGLSHHEAPLLCQREPKMHRDQLVLATHMPTCMHMPETRVHTLEWLAQSLVFLTLGRRVVVWTGNRSEEK